MGVFYYLCGMKKYTDEYIIERASLYDYPTQFRNAESKIYAVAQRRGLLDILKYKVGRIGNKVKRLVYIYEFPDNSVYVGLTFNECKRKSEHFGVRETSVTKHVNKTGLTPNYKVVSDGYIDAQDAAILEETLRLQYIKDGWFILNKRKGGALGGHSRKWEVSDIKDVASLCSTREEFMNKYPGAVNAAKQLKVYDEVTKHMSYMLNYHTIESITETAKKYKTIQEFKKKHGSMYVIVRRHGWGEQVFKHMINGKCELLILDTETGVYYLGVKEAHQAKNLKISENTLQHYLRGSRTNKTSLILV